MTAVHPFCRFIQKQGLDRTFVECDNHMWRVDTRPLPHDVTVDGGSDWIVLHRNYSRYLVTDKSKFLTDIKKYYEFSLLPAEVYRCFCLHTHIIYLISCLGLCASKSVCVSVCVCALDSSCLYERAHSLGQIVNLRYAFFKCLSMMCLYVQ